VSATQYSLQYSCTTVPLYTRVECIPQRIACSEQNELTAEAKHSRLQPVFAHVHRLSHDP
jgi:hypothetical protein